MLNIPLLKSTRGQRTFIISTGNILNSMDSYVRALKPVSAFKFKMKSKLVMDFIDYRVNNFYNCNLIFIFVLT